MTAKKLVGVLAAIVLVLLGQQDSLRSDTPLIRW